MKAKFDILFMEEARQFLSLLDEKSRKKILYNIDKAAFLNDPKLFRKLQGEIWEFRTFYNKTYYRLLAFWDKTQLTKTYIIATHGIIKKSDRISVREIEKAELIRQHYFNINRYTDGK